MLTLLLLVLQTEPQPAATPSLAGRWAATFTLDSAWRLPKPRRARSLTGVIVLQPAPVAPPSALRSRPVHPGRFTLDFTPFGFTVTDDEVIAWFSTPDSIRIILNPTVDHGHMEVVGVLQPDRIEGEWHLISDRSGARGSVRLRRAPLESPARRVPNPEDEARSSTPSSSR